MISTSSDRKSVYQSHNRLMPTPLATPSIEYCAMVTAPRESRFPRIASRALRGSPQTPIRARLPEAACNFDILGEPGWTPRLWTERPRHSGPRPADPRRTAAHLAGPGQPRRGSHRECDPTPTRSPIEHPRRPAPRGSVNDRSAFGTISRGSPRLAGRRLVRSGGRLEGSRANPRTRSRSAAVRAAPGALRAALPGQGRMRIDAADRAAVDPHT